MKVNLSMDYEFISTTNRDIQKVDRLLKRL